MAKRKIIRKSNRPFTYNPHYYSWGGDFKNALGGTKPFDLKGTFSGGNVAGMLKGGLASGIGSAVGNIAGGAISGGLESGAGSAISNIGGTIGSAVSAVNPVLGGIISAGSGIIGGLTNRMFGSKLNKEKIAEVEGSNKAINTVMVDNSSADSVMDQWANQDFGADFSKSDIGKDGWFSNKAKNKYKELKKQQDIARNRALTSYENAADAADTQSDLNAMASFAAFGGPLGIWGGYGSGAIGYKLAKENLGIKALNARKWHDDGGPLDSLVADINRRSRADFIQRLLDPDRDYINDWESDNIATHKLGYATDDKGAIVFPNVQRIDGRLYDFTDPKNKRGKWDALESAIERGDTLRMTPAQAEEFTKTYKKYYPKGKTFKAFGGWLNSQGGDFSNGVTIIGNGGTHEENPMEGVPMGMDAEGNPNLVEQGEVIFNDYVFSNRLFADGGLLESFNLPKSYDGYSFAAIAEKLGEESKERPNDPISKRGLLSSMSRLQQAQETVRQQTQEGQEGVQYAHGGRMGTLFDGLGDMPNFLDGVDYGDWQDYGTLLEPINAEDLWNESMAGADEGDKGNNNSKLTWLRYAPVVGAAIGLGQNLFSKPDYTSADTILEAANQAGNYTPVGYTPIGNYLQYRPFDRNFYLNKLNAQAGATRRAIMNTTSPSRNAALLAADYNAQGRLGDLARQAEEYNLAQRQAVETFNRGTNMANAEMGLKAAMANQEAALKARSSRLSGVAQAMAMRDAIDSRRNASMSANMTNFFNSLGDIGREEYSRNLIISNPALYYSIDSKGNISYKNGYENLSEAEKEEVRDAANKAKKKKAKGGYLTIKKK